LKESEISAGSKNHRLIKILLFGGKLNYIGSKVDDEGDDDNKCDVYIYYDNYGGSDSDDNHNGEDAT
jgi:hypothetical protein